MRSLLLGLAFLPSQVLWVSVWLYEVKIACFCSKSWVIYFFFFLIFEIQCAWGRVRTRSYKVSEFWSGEYRKFTKQQQETHLFVNVTMRWIVMVYCWILHRIYCQVVACELEFTPLSFDKTLLIPIQMQIHSIFFFKEGGEARSRSPWSAPACGGTPWLAAATSRAGIRLFCVSLNRKINGGYFLNFWGAS